MILVALGSNLPSAHGDSRRTLDAAMAAMAERGLSPVRRSRYWRSAPVPRSDQPDYLNAVAEIRTTLAPDAVMAELHRLEAEFGRTRLAVNEARSLDLDLIDYDGRVSAPGTAPILPHPRMHERAFVLAPLLELAPDWRHPRLGSSAAELLAGLPAADRAHCRVEP